MTSTNVKNHQSPPPEKVRQLYQHTDDALSYLAEWIPLFCVEARVDFNDVRTGFRETVSLSMALEIYSDNADLLWTDDMIREVDLLKTSASIPDGVRIGALPTFVNANFFARMENQFVQYLLRSFEKRIYRNFDLNLYSHSGESKSDFSKRCRDLFVPLKRQELDRLHDVFNRKLAQVRQKYVGVSDSGKLEEDKSNSSNRDAFFHCSEQITELFNSAEIRVRSVSPLPPISSSMQELDERLRALEWEAYQAISKLSDQYEEKANAVDEYILHPNLRDIHFVRSCILWMPKGIV